MAVRTGPSQRGEIDLTSQRVHAVVGQRGNPLRAGRRLDGPSERPRPASPQPRVAERHPIAQSAAALAADTKLGI